jgi:transcriptional regulator with XRE-family HTH domain
MKNDLDPVVAALRERRYALGLTLEGLSDKLGYTANTIWGWENGRANPPLVRIHEWAQSLGMRLVVRERGDG